MHSQKFCDHSLVEFSVNPDLIYYVVGSFGMVETHCYKMEHNVFQEMQSHFTNFIGGKLKGWLVLICL